MCFVAESIGPRVICRFEFRGQGANRIEFCGTGLTTSVCFRALLFKEKASPCLFRHLLLAASVSPTLSVHQKRSLVNNARDTDPAEPSAPLAAGTLRSVQAARYFRRQTEGAQKEECRALPHSWNQISLPINRDDVSSLHTQVNAALPLLRPSFSPPHCR